MQPLSAQIFAFLLLTVLGVSLGFIYDCYRVIRHIWQPKTWGTIFGDALLWLFITLITYRFLLYTTWGEVRLYVFIALICGCFFYLKLLSRRTRHTLLRIYIFLSQIITRTWRWLLRPLRFVWIIVTLPPRLLFLLVTSVISGGRQVAAIFLLPVHRWRSRRPPPPPDQNCTG